MARVDVEVLQALRRGPVFPGDLGNPEEVRQSLTELREAGYVIEAMPDGAVRLVSAPDRLIADDLSGRLHDVALARQILVFEETDSTNDVACQLGRQGAPEGVVVFAEQQRRGRGRLGRQWVSTVREGLWFSILLRPGSAPEEWMRLTTWAAVSVALALEEISGLPMEIKWPNDVQINGRKVTGILIEAYRIGEEGYAVAGLGVNVNQTAFDPDIRARAVSLREAAGRSFDRQEVAVAILRQLDALYRRLDTAFEEIVREAERRSILFGKYVEIGSGQHREAGVVEGLTSEGALRIRDASGSLRIVSGGEVTVVFAASEMPA